MKMPDIPAGRTCEMSGRGQTVVDLALLKTQQREEVPDSRCRSGRSQWRDLTQRRAGEQHDAAGGVTDRDLSVACADRWIDQSCMLNSTLDPLWELSHRSLLS